MRGCEFERAEGNLIGGASKAGRKKRESDPFPLKITKGMCGEVTFSLACCNTMIFLIKLLSIFN